MNPMNHDTPITPDDPRLTAYVLGELDEQEHEAVRAQVEASAELQAAVDGIRTTADALTSELAAELEQDRDHDAATAPAAWSLGADARNAIDRAADDRASEDLAADVNDTGAAPRRLRFRPFAYAAVGMAAVIGLAFIYSPRVQRARDPFAGVNQRITPDDIVHNQARQERSGGTAGREERVAGRPNGVTTLAVPEQRLNAQGQSVGIDEKKMKLTPAIGGTQPQPTVYSRHGFLVPFGQRDGSAPAPGEHRTRRIVPPERFVDMDGHDRWSQLTPSNEAYEAIIENPFHFVTDHPLSTFSIDVDTAGYANVRRFLKQGSLPPPDAVRIEEMINYFEYGYPQPVGEHPFSVNVEIADCPWQPDHRLARVGLKGYEVDDRDRPPANLVFLLDVSGSMNVFNKLPLVKQAMRMLVAELGGDDYVSIVVYAGASGLVLPPTACADEQTILDAIDRLNAGGSTNGGAGIELAYKTASEAFIEGGINRVILATDGDFNVGVTSRGSLVELIEEKAQSGVFLSVLGFGMGNLKDATLEKLADKGNGHYAYIDDIAEARKVLVDQMGGTLMTIAKDVKIQVEFNPGRVEAYRLIGYENRKLAARDFNDDTKDAGEIGAGHTVTALYELVPVGHGFTGQGVDPLKYQRKVDDVEVVESDETMTVKLRYKEPDGDVSRLIEVPVSDEGMSLDDASEDFVFASSVAAFGMILRGSNHAGAMTLSQVSALAREGRGDDVKGYRSEFIDLVNAATVMRR